ncbi:glycosyltransferase family 4 protein [Lactobacillus johnsonii]|uniref:Glycosyltransferase family 1 protein n=1 Tax=Lactobacillus johnsonii (strain FI9785) TaxID=633699 RepID=D0R4M6_LACJF|nr:glycosyltransferase family 4 protein [Lactobacillus johnsonii]CAX67039.1 unnamed protein product [Lactobacillus johnsonii FI9785]
MDKRIKVIHVAEAAGGVERYLEALLKYSDKCKIENILVCSQNYDYKKFESLTSRVIVLKMSHNIDPIADIKVEKALRNIIKRERPDIVYAHSSKAGAFARIADIGLKNKVIYNPHGWAFNMQQSTKKKQMYKWVEKISAYFCDQIVCISDAERLSALREKICKPNKLQVIYNGIDFVELNKESKQNVDLSIPKNSYVIGMVGRLSEQKAPDIFVEAAHLIKEQIPNAFFLMVGDGPLKKQIERQIDKLGLKESFCITGWVENPTAYMKKMDIGLLISRWEGFGLVIPEYMASNIPVIASRVDAIPNLIEDGKDGILVNKDDFKSIAENVVRLKTNPDLYTKLKLQAMRKVKNFDIKRVASETENLYFVLYNGEMNEN